MPYERSDYEQLRNKGRREQVATHQRELTHIAQAKVPMDIMTKSAEWDFYLSVLQAEIDKLDALMNVMQEADAREASFSYEELARQKALRMQIAVQKDTLEQVIRFPKEIFEKGEKAAIALRDYSE